MLEQAYELWRTGVAGLDDAGLAAPLGPKAAPYAEQSVADHVAHINREVIAHGAEMCLLRDLYRAGQIQADPLAAAAFAGDVAAVRAVITQGASSRPNLVAEVAGLGHFDVVEALLEAGCDPNAGSPSALHFAAAFAEPVIVERLIAAGADRTACDSTWGLTPQGWAEFFGRADVAVMLAP